MMVSPQDIITATAAIFSALGGGALTAAIAKRHIFKVFGSVDTLGSDVAAIKTDVAVMRSQFDEIRVLRELTRQHDRKITRLEARHYARNGADYPDSDHGS